VDLYEFMQESNARARRGRALGRMMIFVVFVVVAFMALVWIASPNFIGGVYDPGPLWFIVPAIGIVGLVGGLIWMVRIFRADPEPEGAKGWRYRD
jgi:cytochrome bd-type quinol oxidase subunit 2